MNENDPTDPLPGLVAGLDQMVAMSGEIARVTRGFYLSFVEEGFNHKDALWLALSYVRPSDPPAEEDA